MPECLNIDVTVLDAHHRRALEEVIGRPLTAAQRLVISVVDTEASANSLPPQTLDDWIHVYDGLSDEDIEDIDKIAKARARLTRPAG